MHSDNSALPIVIVGAGPVGLTAALAARHHGLPVEVIEADPEARVRPGSRATYLYRETLDLWESVAPGVTKAMVARSANWHTLRTTYAGKEVYVKHFPPAPAGRFGAAVSQRETESILLHRCREEGVGFRWDSPVSGAQTDETGLTLDLSDGSSLRASYAVVADGARSVVRRSLGIQLDGDRSESSFVIVDVAEDPAQPMERARTFHYRHPAVGGRNVLLVPFGGGWRLDLECHPGEDAAPWQEEPKLSEWITAVAGAKYAASRVWVSTYRFNRSVALSYTDPHARVILAGEAAHLFPPFGGGRGLNSGVPDAITAVEAIVSACQASDRKEAAETVRSAAKERRLAGLANREAAASALARMEAASVGRRLQERTAALLAPRSRRMGEWLDRGPMGSPAPARPTSRF